MSIMKPGRELDALVAEKVMGWTVAGWGTAIHVEGEWSVHLDSDPAGWACHADKHPLYVRHCQCEFLDGAYWAESEAYIVEKVRGKHPDYKGDETPTPKLGGHHQGCLGVVPEFSTDIAAAWEVVDAWVSSGLAFWTDSDGHTGFRAGCSGANNRPASRDVEGRSIPHAICLAALKSVGAL